MNEIHERTIARRSRPATGQPTERPQCPHRRQQRMIGWYDEDGSRSLGEMNEPGDEGVGGSGGACESAA